MRLRLFFTELPAESTLNALDRRLSGLARSQEAIDGGRRLWITHIPETITRPFLHARAFDLFVSALRFSNAEIEDFRIGIGAAPKRIMICDSPDDSQESLEICFAIATEVMSRCAALLNINEALAKQMFHLKPPFDDEIPPHLLDDFPGSVYEVAHEKPDGDLGIEWFVDARWLRAWTQQHYQKNKSEEHSESSRFASLDYF